MSKPFIDSLLEPPTQTEQEPPAQEFFIDSLLKEPVKEAPPVKKEPVKDEPFVDKLLPRPAFFGYNINAPLSQTGIDTADPIAQYGKALKQEQSELVKQFLVSNKEQKPVNIARSLPDEDLGLVTDTVMSDLKSYPSSISRALTREGKIRLAKKDLETQDPKAQSAQYALLNLGNLFNVNAYLDRRGLNPFSKGQYDVYLEAANRTIAERPFDIKSLGFTAGVQIPKILLEFAAIPDVAGRAAMLKKYPRLRSMISAGLRFGTREMLQAPEPDETIGDRLKKVGLSTTIGTGVGATGAFIPSSAVRIPLNVAGFSLLTAAQGGTKEDIMETAFTVAGFEALGLAKRAIRAKSARVRQNLENKAIKTLRANSIKSGINLKSVPDSALREIVRSKAKEDFWNKQYKKGKVTREVRDMRIGQEADKMRPILEAIARQQPIKTPTKQPTVKKTAKLTDKAKPDKVSRRLHRRTQMIKKELAGVEKELAEKAAPTEQMREDKIHKAGQIGASDKAIDARLSEIAGWTEKDLDIRLIEREMIDEDKAKEAELEAEAPEEEKPKTAVQQHLEFKKKHPKTIVIMKVGDFYETFGEDAKKVGKSLGKKPLKVRGVENVSIPYYDLDSSVKKLVSVGYKVAISEPTEEKPTEQIEKKIPEAVVETKPGPAKTLTTMRKEAQQPADVTVTMPKERLRKTVVPAKGKKILVKDKSEPDELIKIEDMGNGLGLKGKTIIHIPSQGIVGTMDTVAEARRAITTIAEESGVDFTQDFDALEAGWKEWIRSLGFEGTQTEQADKVKRYFAGKGEEVSIEDYAKAFPAFKKIGYSPINAAGKIKKRLKDFAKTVPEFTVNPTFVVEVDKGEPMLVFKDNYKYRFNPEHFGLDPKALKDKQTIRFDLDSFGIKPAGKKALKLAEPFLGEKKPIGRTTEKQQKEIEAIQKRRAEAEPKPDTETKEKLPKPPSERLEGGNQAGGTTILPDVAAEIESVGRKMIKNPPKLMQAVTKLLRRNSKKAVTYFRTLGGAGEKLANDIEVIDFNVTRKTNRDNLSIRDIFMGVPKSGRERIAKVMNGRLPEANQPAWVMARVRGLRQVLDRAMNEAAGLGVQRRVSGVRKDIKGSGKAYPQIPNEKGQAFLEQAFAEGKSNARVFSWAQQQVTNGKFADIDEAIGALMNYRQMRLRATNPYLESSRIELPEEYIEWDGSKVLPGLIERNWKTVEGTRRWGKDEHGISFPLANSRIETIRTTYGNEAARISEIFIQTSFGKRMPDKQTAQRISGNIRGYQFLTKVGNSPITILRNMFDRIAKGFTISPMGTIRAFAKYPPFINQFIGYSQDIEYEMIRRGAVFGHGSISEGFEAGSVVTELASRPFSISERGNQVFISIVAYQKLLDDVALLAKRQGKDNILTQVSNRVLDKVFGGKIKLSDPVKTRIKEGSLNPDKLIERLEAGKKISQVEIDFFLHQAIKEKAFPMIMSTKPVWYDNSPWLKVLAQFKTWPVRQLNMVWQDVVKYTVKTGDPSRLIGFLIGTLIAGELYNIARDFLFDKQESIVSVLSDGSTKDELYRAIINDLLDGGVVGMLADFTYGVYDWITGVSARTGKNIWDTFAFIKKQPKLTPQALERLLEKEITPYRQIKKVIEKIDRRFVNKKNISMDFSKWRRRGWEWRLNKKDPTFKDKLDVFTDDILFGTTEHRIGENTLAYELASRQIIAGDVEDAAKYLKLILDGADDRKKTLAGIKQSRNNRSPLGKVAKKDMPRFMSQFSNQERREGIELQNKYLGMYNKALRMALSNK